MFCQWLGCRVWPGKTYKARNRNLDKSLPPQDKPLAIIVILKKSSAAKIKIATHRYLRNVVQAAILCGE